MKRTSRDSQPTASRSSSTSAIRKKWIRTSARGQIAGIGYAASFVDIESPSVDQVRAVRALFPPGEDANVLGQGEAGARRTLTDADLSVAGSAWERLLKTYFGTGPMG